MDEKKTTNELYGNVAVKELIEFLSQFPDGMKCTCDYGGIAVLYCEDLNILDFRYSCE